MKGEVWSCCMKPKSSEGCIRRPPDPNPGRLKTEEVLGALLPPSSPVLRETTLRPAASSSARGGGGGGAGPAAPYGFGPEADFHTQASRAPGRPQPCHPHPRRATTGTGLGLLSGHHRGAAAAAAAWVPPHPQLLEGLLPKCSADGPFIRLGPGIPQLLLTFAQNQMEKENLESFEMVRVRCEQDSEKMVQAFEEEGYLVRKHGRRGAPHHRVLRLSPDRSALHWAPPPPPPPQGRGRRPPGRPAAAAWVLVGRRRRRRPCP
uniref:Uncharacterized protein n=1 Tax=Heterosigma akashiwo TaxID=2829 RepID=A0A7S3XPL1_HETAK